MSIFTSANFICPTHVPEILLASCFTFQFLVGIGEPKKKKERKKLDIYLLNIYHVLAVEYIALAFIEIL